VRVYEPCDEQVETYLHCVGRKTDRGAEARVRRSVVHVVRGSGGARVEELGSGVGVSEEPDAEAFVQRERAEASEAGFAGGVLWERVCVGLRAEQRVGVGGERGGARVWYGEACEGEGGQRPRAESC